MSEWHWKVDCLNTCANLNSEILFILSLVKLIWAVLTILDFFLTVKNLHNIGF